jgi:hypothetical protein
MEASSEVRVKRQVTNDDIKRYEAMVEKFIRDSVVKNWSDARKSGPGAFLGTSGKGLDDIRQDLRCEVVVALQNYNPNYRTKENRPVKESTFVYQHLTFRIGQMMKRLTKRRAGYGIRHNPVHLVIQEGVEEHSVLDLDLVSAIDYKRSLGAKGKSQVERYLESQRFQ